MSMDAEILQRLADQEARLRNAEEKLGLRGPPVPQDAKAIADAKGIPAPGPVVSAFTIAASEMANITVMRFWRCPSP